MKLDFTYYVSVDFVLELFNYTMFLFRCLILLSPPPLSVEIWVSTQPCFPSFVKQCNTVYLQTRKTFMSTAIIACLFNFLLTLHCFPVDIINIYFTLQRTVADVMVVGVRRCMYSSSGFHNF